jgi:predicted glycogen debranching enzyme
MRIQPIEFARARSLEWLETNGLGGFASSTVVGMNTRRYHGLLTAATRPPVGRLLLLSKLEETLVVRGERFDLAVNQYPGAIHPNGHRYLREFRLDPLPTFVYSAGGFEIVKRVFMVHGENSVVVEYEVSGAKGEDCVLEIRPLIAFRDYHGTTHRNGELNPAVEFEPGLASVQPYAGLPRLFLAHDAAESEATGDWYDNFEYEIERERGLDFREDLFNPLLLRFSMSGHGSATVIASTLPHAAADAPALRAGELARRRAVEAAAPSADPLIRQLALAADQFIVQRGDLKTIVAGYHWFSDWGRDTMIALPGLTLVTGRFEVARDILLAFAREVNRGMLPNRFPDDGEDPEYNTVDATLWYFEAIRAYLAYTGEFEFVRRHLLPVLHDIVNWHISGTRYGIRVDTDGLLACGEPGVQLTWMDAKVGDWVVTPRSGKPVEIQALWYNALRVLEDLARRSAEPAKADSLDRMACRARESFLAQFWNTGENCLYDVVDGAHCDGAIRPNQIFAVSLPHRMLPPDRARMVVETVQRELLTPVGLRSLSPRDSRYRGRYEGGVLERDSAYHQGTVWPWLLGPFLTAYRHAAVDEPAARAQVTAWLAGLQPHLAEAGLGQIGEIADGDAPHSARGCIAQAWSVGELLRAAVEDVYPNRSPIG